MEVEWIKFSDRLPEIGQKVIALMNFVDDEWVEDMATRNKDDTFEFNCFLNMNKKHLKYWMPIPPPPEGVKLRTKLLGMGEDDK